MRWWVTWCSFSSFLVKSLGPSSDIVSKLSVIFACWCCFPFLGFDAPHNFFLLTSPLSRPFSTGKPEFLKYSCANPPGWILRSLIFLDINQDSSFKNIWPVGKRRFVSHSDQSTTFCHGKIHEGLGNEPRAFWSELVALPLSYALLRILCDFPLFWIIILTDHFWNNYWWMAPIFSNS